MDPDKARQFDCPSHLRFSKRVQDLATSHDPEDRRLYLAVLVYVLDINVFDEWPELSQSEDERIRFSSADGQAVEIRVRAVGRLRLIREARWQGSQ